jgi:hypothetical protein
MIQSLTYRYGNAFAKMRQREANGEYGRYKKKLTPRKQGVRGYVLSFHPKTWPTAIERLKVMDIGPNGLSGNG